MSLTKDLEKRVMGLAVNDDVDIILVKERHLADRLANLRLPLKKKIGVLVVGDFNDLSTLSEKQVNKLGWIREINGDN